MLHLCISNSAHNYNCFIYDMDNLKLWMETEGIKYSPNFLIEKGVTYAYTRWNNMMRYLEDGRIRIEIVWRKTPSAPLH